MMAILIVGYTLGPANITYIAKVIQVWIYMFATKPLQSIPMAQKA
jgi:hypothetical protein